MRTCRRAAGQGPLQLERAGQSVGRPAERGHEAVALALLDRAHAAVAADAVGDQLVIGRHRDRHGLGLVLPAPGRALDVGQQQGDGADRQVEAGARCQAVSHRGGPADRRVQAGRGRGSPHAASVNRRSRQCIGQMADPYAAFIGLSARQ